MIAALGSYPVLTLTVRHAVGASFFILALLGLIRLWRTRAVILGQWDQQAGFFTLAMASPVLAAFSSQAFHLDINSKPYDEASRFLLAIPVYMLLRITRIDVLQIFRYSFPIGALVALFWIGFDSELSTAKRLESSFLNKIHLGDLSVVLGLCSLFCVRLEQSDHRMGVHDMALILLQVAGFLAGLYLAARTGSRGSLIAVPPALLLWMYYQTKSWALYRRFSLAILLIGVATAVLMAVDIAAIRMYSTVNEFVDYFRSEKDTGVGVRFQIWGAALQMFFDNMIFGMGPESYKGEFQRFVENGQITSQAAEYGAAEIHNQILSYAVKYGSIGLVSILAVHLLPLYYFAKFAEQDSGRGRQLGMLGVCFVVSFLVFGLTVEIFNLKMTVTFYTLTVAALLASASPIAARRLSKGEKVGAQ